MSTAATTVVTATEAAASKYGPGIVKRPNRYFVDPRTVAIKEGWNHRFDMGDIDTLAAQIAAELKRDPASGGLIHDLHVKKLAEPKPNPHAGWPDIIFEVVDGERRTRATHVLLQRGETFPDGVPAKIVPANADETQLHIRSFVANQAKSLLPLEQAAAFKTMQDAGMTLKQIEAETGMSDNTIVGALALLTADDSVVDAVKSGKIKGGLAKSIAVNARGNKEKQKELVAEAVAAGKDKKKLAAVKTKVDDARRAKAAKKGLTLKMRALTNDQLSAIGAKMSEELAKQMEVVGLPFDSDLVTWLKDSSPEMRVAYSFGVLQAFKAAAGVNVPLALG